MKRERWEEVERLYHAALEREPTARAAFLGEACAGDVELRREVAGLLAYDDPEASFIQAPAIQNAARALAAQSRNESQTKAETVLPGERQISAYQLLEPLGRGGMGEVHLALRSRRRILAAVPARSGLSATPARRGGPHGISEDSRSP